jgi:hypothetical protein
MRTTITLDPDVEQLLKNAMRERDVSFKEIVNDALRMGLRGPVASRRKRFKQRTFAMGPAAPGFNWDKALQIASRLEDEEIMRKMATEK